MLDCQRCGACCRNPPDNRAEAFPWWVEIEPDDRLLTRPDLVRKLVVRDADGVPHLRLAADGACLALRGRFAVDVWCAAYADRPSPCRRVQPGDKNCLRYRAAHGLP